MPGYSTRARRWGSGLPSAAALTAMRREPPWTPCWVTRRCARGCRTWGRGRWAGAGGGAWRVVCSWEALVEERAGARVGPRVAPVGVVLQTRQAAELDAATLLRWRD